MKNLILLLLLPILSYGQLFELDNIYYSTDTKKAIMDVNINNNYNDVLDTKYRIKVQPTIVDVPVNKIEGDYIPTTIINVQPNYFNNTYLFFINTNIEHRPIHNNLIPLKTIFFIPEPHK